MMTTPLHNAKLYHIRDLFLFSCYTGIPYGDMCMLTKEDLATDEDGTLWIKTSRKKTKIDYEVPLLDILIYIIDKYRDVDSDGKLLPMYSNSEMNRHLKDIGKGLGLHQPLTMYCARHSWASIARDEGIPLSVISEGMRHDSEKTTQIYLASLKTEVIDKANRKILELL